MKTKIYKRNLVIGFGVSLLILMVSSVASYISIRNLLDSAEWVRHTNEVIYELNRIETNLKEAETSQRGYLLTGADDFKVPYRAAQERITIALAHVQSLTADNPQQQQHATELKRLLNVRLSVLQRNLHIKDSAGTVKISNLLVGRDYNDSIASVMHMLETNEQDLLAARTERMQAFSTFTPVLIVVAALLALLITGAFYVRVRNDFEEKSRLQESLEEKDRETSQRIDIIKDIADKISAGSYDIRVNDEQRDALGSLGGSLNKMASSLQHSFNLLSDKEWTQTGLAGLNDAMIGEKTLQTLASSIVELMATYTTSHAGALYILERDTLHAYAGYAYVAPPGREIFKVGEGLVGQSIISGKLLELRDIPEGSIEVMFTTAQAKPRHVVAVPLYDGYTIKGAIELATLDSFSARELEFMQAASRNIGIAISTAQNRRRLQELLEETQSQAEELQTQHSELENLNSELEVQAEKLQQSDEELRVQQEELRQANEELEERAGMLEDRNTMIVQRNAEIQAKAEALAQSTRYKSDFLANMSHELRTPLNSILLLSRLLTENLESNLSNEQIEYARVIQSSGTGLLALIDEILDLSKIESGKMNLEYDMVPVKDIVHDMEALFRPVAAEKGLAFHINVAPGLPEAIETDKLRLEQIVQNLLSNGLKFTEQGSVTLDLSLNDNATMLKITVTDTGIGVADDKQQLIFEAFQQADGSTRRKYGGTGLGLSISRELVKRLGGEISLQSDAGKGSIFTVMVPLARRDGLSAPKEEPTGVRESSLPRTQEDTYISTTIPDNIADDRDKVNPGDKTILIVEDDTSFARSLLDFTRNRGYKGIATVRGDECLTLARQYMPVGILLDIKLPVKNGWEVMEELKAEPATRHIPVHIMSSHAIKNERITRAVDFVDKPVSYEKLQQIFQKIEFALENHPKKVLIIEEDPQHAKALAYFLGTLAIRLATKQNLAEATDALKQNEADCVILDMNVADPATLTALDEVRKTPALENVPIIIFTGKTLSQTETSRLRKYADSIVVKTAHSYKRILDEVSLFLHLMERQEGGNSNGNGSLRYHKLGHLEEVLRNKTVLIADDDVRNIFSLTKAMESFNMTVITAVDGRDALRQLRANPGVDIVLMDMMMPEMDGYESTAAIRRDPDLKHIPVIAVTAKAMREDRAKCINAGASDYITKPVDVDQLLSLLRVWLYDGHARKA